MRRYMHVVSGASIGTLLSIAGAITPANAFVVNANGSCIQGNCAAPDVLGVGLVTGGPFSGTFSVNGDPYTISGTVNATNFDGLNVTLTQGFTLTYSGLVPLAQADLFDVMVRQDFVSLQTVGGGLYQFDTTGTFGSTVPLSSSLAIDNLIDGSSPSGGGAVVFPPGAFDTGFAGGTVPVVLTDSLSDAFVYSFAFGMGAPPEFFVEVAEPRSALLLGCGLLGLVATRRRARRVVS